MSGVMDQRGQGVSQTSFYSTGFKKTSSPDKNSAEETFYNSMRHTNVISFNKELSKEERNLLLLLEHEIISNKMTVDILFSKFDTNHDNLINLHEFNNGLKGLGLILNSEDLILFFKLFDLTNSGVISFENFQEVLKKRRNNPNEMDLKKKNSEEYQGF